MDNPLVTLILTLIVSTIASCFAVRYVIPKRNPITVKLHNQKGYELIIQPWDFSEETLDGIRSELSRCHCSYSGIYVSWSKSPKVDYLENKLYGPLVHLTCEISGNRFGIDLEAFGVSRGEEAEVVFPTFSDCVTDIKYLEEWER